MVTLNKDWMLRFTSISSIAFFPQVQSPVLTLAVPLVCIQGRPSASALSQCSHFLPVLQASGLPIRGSTLYTAAWLFSLKDSHDCENYAKNSQCLPTAHWTACTGPNRIILNCSRFIPHYYQRLFCTTAKLDIAVSPNILCVPSIWVWISPCPHPECTPI